MATSKRRVPEEQVATIEEVEAAVAALTEGELLRLAEFAERRIERIGRAADGRDHEDLLGEAYRLTVEGDRSWPKNVHFVAYLCGVMRSVSSHWAEKYGRQLDDGRGQVRTDVDVRTDLVLGEVGTDPRAAATHAETIQAVRALFAGDATTSNILAGIEDGMQASEICALLDLTPTNYASTVRDMRRAMIRAGLKRPTKTQKGPTRG